MDRPNEREFIDRLMARDPAAWATYMQVYDPQVKSVTAWKKWNFDEPTRLDIVQSTHEAVLHSLNVFRQECTLLTYVKRIAFHCCMTEVRRQIKSKTFTVPLMYDDEWGGLRAVDHRDDVDVIQEILRTELCKEVFQLLEQLHPTCQDALKRIYMEGVSYASYAKTLGVAINTICARVSKCIEKARNKIRFIPSMKDRNYGR